MKNKMQKSKTKKLKGLVRIWILESEENGEMGTDKK